MLARDDIIIIRPRSVAEQKQQHSRPTVTAGSRESSTTHAREIRGKRFAHAWERKRKRERKKKKGKSKKSITCPTRRGAALPLSRAYTARAYYYLSRVIKIHRGRTTAPLQWFSRNGVWRNKNHRFTALHFTFSSDTRRFYIIFIHFWVFFFLFF